MPATQTDALPMARRRQLPRYFTWRAGRPCWNPGPGLRSRRGLKRIDLKHPDGSWMTMGEAVDRCDEINAAVDAGTAPALPRGEQTLKALFTLFKAHDDFKKLAENTRGEYEDHMEILEEWAGDLPAAAIKRADMKTFFADQREGRGAARSHAIYRTLRRVLNFAVDDLEWFETNRAARLKLPVPAGRLSKWSMDEIAAFVAAADWIEADSQGDAQIMGLCFGQNRGDVITLPPLQLVDGVYQSRRQKTDNQVFTAPLRILTQRLTLAHARNEAAFPNVAFTTELVSTRTGSAYDPDGSFFTHEHAAVRAIASGLVFVVAQATGAWPDLKPLRGSKIYQWVRTLPVDTLFNLPFTPMPSIWGKTFQDLRDTSITMLLTLTKGDIPKVSNWSGLSMRTVQTIADKHYFVRNAELALETGKMVDAFLATTKIGA